MKRALLTLGILLLAACTQQQPGVTQTYQLTITEPDSAKQTELVDASVRVIDRRLGALGEKLVSHSVSGTGANVSLTVTASNADALATVTDQLKEPFDLQFMSEVPDAQADVVVAGQGAFKGTGVTQNDLDWTTFQLQPDGVKARVELIFTTDGHAKMAKVFQDNQGKIIGLFVRKKLVSKLIVDTAALKDRIVIGDIPTIEIAQTFSDDVNVGMHVQFSPR